MTRFLLLVNYDGGVVDTPMLEWDPEDVKVHLQYYQDLNKDLEERGELVDSLALAWPESARIVRSDGVSAPVLTDGPFPESKELLARGSRWSTSSRRRGRSRSLRWCRRCLGPAACRSSSRSRSARS